MRKKLHLSACMPIAWDRVCTSNVLFAVYRNTYCPGVSVTSGKDYVLAEEKHEKESGNIE